MARRRMIDPKFWASEKVGKLTFRQRLFLIGLFSNADDEGRLIGAPTLLRSTIFPYDDIPIEEIEKDLAALERTKDRPGSLVRYEIDGSKFIALTNWKKYQTINRPQKSLLPEPKGIARSLIDSMNDSVNGSVNDSRGHSLNDSRAKERKGKEKKGSTSEKNPSDPIPEVAPLLEKLELHIRTIIPGKNFKANWRSKQGRAFRLLRDADGIDFPAQLKTLEWVRTGSSRDAIFWRKNILSAEKFRIQYEKLEAARTVESRASGNVTRLSTWTCPKCGKKVEVGNGRHHATCTKCGEELWSSDPKVRKESRVVVS